MGPFEKKTFLRPDPLPRSFAVLPRSRPTRHPRSFAGRIRPRSFAASPATAAATVAATAAYAATAASAATAAATATATAKATGVLCLVCIPIDVLDFIHMHHLLTPFNP